MNPSGQGSALPARIASGAVLIAVVVLALAVGGPLLSALLAAAVVGGAWEYSRLTEAIGARPLACLLYPLAVWLAMRSVLPSSWPVLELGLGVALLVGALAMLRGPGGALGWATAVSGAVFVGLTLGYLLVLYRWHPANHGFGLKIVGLAVGGAIATDTAAYFLGSAFGRHRFFPSISPRKSIEGAVGGALCCVLVLAVLAPPLLGISLWAGAGLGAVITVAGQLGDLWESALKREAGVKDSSNLIPGHGGLLDRLDSLILVAPAVYWYLRMIAFS